MSAGGCDDGAEGVLGLWKSFLISIFEICFGCGAADDEVVLDFAVTEGADEGVGGLPLMAVLGGGVEAAKEPNDFIPSDFIGGTDAGEEDIGAETSSIEPKVTDEPEGMRR